MKKNSEIWVDFGWIFNLGLIRLGRNVWAVVKTLIAFYFSHGPLSDFSSPCFCSPQDLKNDFA